MALQGNLRDFSTMQLLNLISLARQTGCLAIRTPSDAARLYFVDGRLVHAHTAGANGHLETVLVKAGKLPADQAQRVPAYAECHTDTQLGMQLINAGHVSRDDIVRSVRNHLLEIVEVLIGWREGEFEFIPDAAPPADRIKVPVNLESVIIESSRRLQEHERLQEELSDLDGVALRFTGDADARLRNVDLRVEEWRVISSIGPDNTIGMIARANTMDDSQIRKIVCGMLQAGMVELSRPAAATRHKIRADKPPAAKRSVIERLTNQIKRR